jgi:hypothetical protein
LAPREQKHLDRSLALALLSKEPQRLFIWLSFAPTIDRAPEETDLLARRFGKKRHSRAKFQIVGRPKELV